MALDTAGRPTFTPALTYKDPGAALDFLERAFGFERAMVIRDASGGIVHAQMRFGGGMLMIGPEWGDDTASPLSLGSGKVAQTVHVDLPSGIADHMTRAEAAGAAVFRPLKEEFHGSLVYAARDPEGHCWSFAELVRPTTREEAAARSGLTIEGWTG